MRQNKQMELAVVSVEQLHQEFEQRGKENKEYFFIILVY